MTTPQVSICIPTFNYARYLPDALDSARGQSFTDIEIVVVDNCSDDRTQELMADFCRRDTRIAYHRNDTNIGMTPNFNRSMAQARGKYVKFLCADDVLAPDCVGRMVGVMEAASEVTLVACRRSIFTDDRRQAGTLGYARQSFSRSGRQVIRECFFRGNLIGEPTAVMFRRADAASGMDENYHQVVDLEFWFRLLEAGNLAYLDDALCGIREHDSRGTGRNLRAGRIAADKLRLFQAYANRPYLEGSLPERLRWDARMASSLAREAAAGAGAQRGCRAVRVLLSADFIVSFGPAGAAADLGATPRRLALMHARACRAYRLSKYLSMLARCQRM